MASRFAAFVTAAVWLAILSGAASSSSPSASLTSSTSTSKTSAKPSPSSQCYYPNGKPEQNFSYNYQPCGGRNTTWQQCCIPGQDICTEDGLCTHLTNEWAGAYDYRAACANADWSGCPQVCLDVLSNSWIQVKQCATGEYCCNPDFDNGDCCRDGSRRFHLLDRSPDAKNTTGDDQGKMNGTDASGGGGGSDNSSNKGNDTTQTDDGKTEERNSSNTSTKIGAAVGGAMGGLVVFGGVVGVWLYLRNKRMKQERVVQDEAETKSPGTVESLAMKQAYTPVSEAEAGPAIRQAYAPISEVEARPAVMEMDSTGVYELRG